MKRREHRGYVLGVGVGLAIVTLIALVFLALGTFLWAATAFYGSMLLHAGFSDVPRLTFLQSLGIGFVLSLVTGTLVRQR